MCVCVFSPVILFLLMLFIKCHPQRLTRIHHPMVNHHVLKDRSHLYSFSSFCPNPLSSVKILFNVFCITVSVLQLFCYLSVVSSPNEAAWRDHRPHGAQCVCLPKSGKTLHTGQPQGMSCLSHTQTTNMLNMTTRKIEMKSEMFIVGS